MQDNKNNIDDLEYLAQLGFEKMPVNDADLDELHSKISKRTFSYNNGAYFAFISLIVGIFIGVSLFFTMDNRQIVFSSAFPNKVLNDTLNAKKISPEKIIALDTVTLAKENFIKPKTSVESIVSTPTEENKAVLDTAASIPIKMMDVSGAINKIDESKLKYIINAPIVYIHDLKVTNYTTLYFNKNQYIKLAIKNGLPVSYANKEEYNTNHSNLKQNADYFLHEEFADALLLFKKGKYDQCLYALKIISGYNDDDLNCNFYSGMCYYYKKEYTKAEEMFGLCIENANNSFLEEAMYYEALSLFESGDKETAATKFKAIADEGGFYSEKAKRFLKN